MKVAARLFPLALLVSAVAGTQDSISFERKWTVGDIEKQRIGLAISLPMGDVSLTMVGEQKVLKVYENGDADLQVGMSDVKLTFNGSEMPTPDSTPEPTTIRFNKFSMPLKQGSQGRSIGSEFLTFAYLSPEKPLRVGETSEIDSTSPENPKRKAKGTVKCESLTDGVAKLITNCDVWTETTEDSPIKVAMTNWFRVADAKFIKAEGTFSNLRLQPGMDPTAAQFTMELIEK